MLTVFAVLTVAMVAGVPVAYAIMLAALTWFVTNPDVPDGIFVQEIVGTLTSFPLLAVPFFVFAGVAMAHGGIAERIVDLAQGLIGHRRGGLAQVLVVNSVIMGGMSGSSNADAAIDAKVIVPQMTRTGYPKPFSSALSAASGVIAPILPPGIGMIIYGLLAQVSIGKLFMAGIVPGLLLAVALSFTARIVTKKQDLGAPQPRQSWRDVAQLTLWALPALAMPVLLIGGLRFGVFTPTELGAVAALYTLAVGVFVYRRLGLRQIRVVFEESVLISAIIMVIVAAAATLGAVITYEQLPRQILDQLLGITDNTIILLLILNIVLLVLGSFFEATSLLVIVTPILASLATAFDIDPIQLGVVVVLNLTIGGVTPPIGTVMYTVLGITKVSIWDYTKAIAPFLAALVAVLMLVTYVPIFTVGTVDLLFAK